MPPRAALRNQVLRLRTVAEGQEAARHVALGRGDPRSDAPAPVP